MSKYELISSPAETREGRHSEPDKPSEYGTTSDSPHGNGEARVAFPSCRFILYSMMVLGITASYALRGCLSQTIVAMVNNTATGVAAAENLSDLQCQRDGEQLSHVGGGEFDWNRQLQGTILSAFNYGFILTQVIAGWLADRYGGKWTLGGGLLVLSVLSLLTPVVARLSPAALIALRVADGMANGFVLPSTNALHARWIPASSFTRFVTVVFSGQEFGYLIGMLAGGLLSDYGFAGGWPSVFYVLGSLGCVWALAWFLLCYSSPAEHPRMSAAERAHLDSVIAANHAPKRHSTPWCRMLGSLPVWACTAGNLAQVWSYHTLVTGIPLFYNDVLGLGMTKNGVVAALPHLVSWCTLILGGILADCMRAPGRLSTTTVRKIFCSVIVVPGLLLILSAFVGCSRTLVVALVSIATGVCTFTWGVLVTNPLDLSIAYSSTVLGFTSSATAIASITVPLVIGALTQGRPTPVQWQKVFYITLGIEGAATLFFLLFGSGELQDWNHEQASDASPPETALQPAQAKTDSAEARLNR